MHTLRMTEERIVRIARNNKEEVQEDTRGSGPTPLFKKQAISLSERKEERKKKERKIQSQVTDTVS
jgi:hypothetical protein